MRSWLSRTRREDGAALIETAFVLPIMLLVCVGILEFGRAYQTWQVLTNAAREGARISILAEKTDEDVIAAVRSYMSNGGLPQSATAQVNINRNIEIGPNSGSRIEVNYPFSFMVLNGVIRLITPSSNTGAPLTMQSVALMRNEG